MSTHICSLLSSIEGHISASCHWAWYVSAPSDSSGWVFVVEHGHLGNQEKKRVKLQTGSERAISNEWEEAELQSWLLDDSEEWSTLSDILVIYPTRILENVIKICFINTSKSYNNCVPKQDAAYKWYEMDSSQVTIFCSSIC